MTTLYTVPPVTLFEAHGYDIVQAGTVVPDNVVAAIQSAAVQCGVTINTTPGGAPTAPARLVAGPVLPVMTSGTEYVWSKTDGAGLLLDIITGVAA